MPKVIQIETKSGIEMIEEESACSYQSMDERKGSRFDFIPLQHYIFKRISAHKTGE